MRHKHLAYYRMIALIASMVTVALLVSIWVNESIFKEYRKIQNEYIELISEAQNDHDLIAPPQGINEINLPLLNRKDRCITCHAGISSEWANSGKAHFKKHPGDYLTDHPEEQFGCTICHGGQGLATNSPGAHAIESSVQWPYPLLDEPYIQSACGQCHLAVFQKPATLPGTEVFLEGHQIFTSEGCLGCHKARGVGGYIGHDLTEQGEKTRYEYNFRHIDGEQTVANWLKQHFKDPEMVSPGSRNWALLIKRKRELSANLGAAI